MASFSHVDIGNFVRETNFANVIVLFVEFTLVLTRVDLAKVCAQITG